MLIIVVLSFSVGESYGQEFYQRRDCGDGKVLDDGVCRDIRNVADDNGGSVYWVDTQNGSDGNPGTEAEPFATISRTTQAGFLEPGDWVIIRDGVYREEIRPQESGAVVGGDTLRITWAAFSEGEVVVSGADIVTSSWQAQDDETWRHDWDWNGIWNDPGASAIERRELFVDDGDPLVPVASRSAVVPGTFYVEGGMESDTPTAVYLRTHDDTDPNTHMIEVGQRGQLFQTHGEPDYECGSSGRYYHLVGLTFRHATTHSQRGAVCPGATGSLIEGVTARENNGAGFKVIGSHHLLRDVQALANGRTGLSGSRAENVLIDGAELAYNNYRGHAYFDESGGGKFVRTTGSTFRHLYSHENEGPGFWLDIRNRNNTVERSVFDRNIGFGLNLELKTRDTRVVNNVFSRTSFNSRPHRGFGLTIQLAYDNLVAFNTFIKNGEGGIMTWNDSRDSDPAYEPTRSRRNHIYNNLFVNNLQGPSPEENQMQLADLAEGENVFTGYSNQVNGNAYWPANNGKGFGALYHVPDPQGGTGNFKAESLSEWQSRTIHDSSSFVVSTGEPHVADPDDAAEGWRLVSNSQLTNEAVPLPDQFAPVLRDFDGDPRPVAEADIGADQFSSAEESLIQKITLRKGLNMISSSIQPSEVRLDSIFSDIQSDLVFVRDESGDVYNPGQGVNSIGGWSSDEAYVVYVSSDCTLQIEGSDLASETPLSLETGWNWVPYFPDGSMSVENAMSSITSDLFMVKNYSGKAHIPSQNINDIKNMEPGQGYKVYVTDPTTLIYPTSVE